MVIVHGLLILHFTEIAFPTPQPALKLCSQFKQVMNFNTIQKMANGRTFTQGYYKPSLAISLANLEAVDCRFRFVLRQRINHPLCSSRKSSWQIFGNAVGSRRVKIFLSTVECKISDYFYNEGSPFGCLNSLNIT